MMTVAIATVAEKPDPLVFSFSSASSNLDNCVAPVE